MIDLLAPRYKVIADYPCNPYPIGDVIKKPEIHNSVLLYVTTERDTFGDEIKAEHMTHISTLDKYPHLFRRLEWWEDRHPEEMPQYVKDKSTGKIYKVADPSQNGRIWHVDGEIEHRFIARPWYAPATLAEYEAFKTTHP